MDLLHTLKLRVRSLLGARSLDAELDEELRHHVEMQAAEFARMGIPAAEARRRALAEFGGVDRMAEECRDARTGSHVHLLLRAVRLAARRLRREPSFLLPAAATIAIGLGALISIFTLVDAVLLRPLPYPDDERIVVLRHTLPGWGIQSSGQSAGTFAHYLESSASFEALGAWFDRELSITESDNPERIRAALVTPGVLRVLGVQPLLGRAFNDEDAGGSSVMLSHETWQARYAGAADVVGRTVRINGVEREIIGVLPRGTDFPRHGIQMLFGMGSGADAEGGELRDLYMEAIGRLRPGVSVAEAQAELTRLIAALPARYGDVTQAQLDESRIAPRLETLRASVTGEVRPALVLLLCTALFVMLIALANVANLVLVRAEHQRREIAVERALGAGSGSVAVRFVAEYGLLTLLGATAGLGLAWLAVTTRFGFDAWHLPRLHDAALTGTGFLAAGAAALLTAVTLTALGIARTAAVDVQAILKGSLHRVTSSRESRAAQHGLSVLQMALACALLVASAVMVQSVARLARVPLGFTPEQVLAFDVALPARQYSDYTAQAAFHANLSARLRALPGVTQAGAVTLLPLTNMPNWSDAPVLAPDMPAPEVPPMISLRSAQPEYFEAMEIPLLRGRAFESTDVRDDGAGVILAASVARMLFGTIDVIGRTIELPGARTGVLTVVGVAGDIRDATLAAPAAPLVYLPSIGEASLADGRTGLPVWPGEMTHVVRSSLPASSLLPAIRAALQEQDPNLPVAWPRALNDLVAAGSAQARMTAWLLIAAAAGSLLLGIVGIYGVMAYAVSRRAPELALRIALGATPGSVTRMVLRQGAMIAAVGVALGLCAAFALTRLLAGLLYEVSPHEPAAFTIVPVAMMVMALLACGIPARRAARTDPGASLSSP